MQTWFKIAACATLFALAPAASAGPREIEVKKADAVLQPGDILVKFVIGNEAMSARDKITSKSIGMLMTVFKWSRSRFNEAVHKGHVKAEHAMLYVGNGMVAESVGEGVRVSSLEIQKGLYLAGYRPTDAALAHRAVEIATRWAKTGRMKYAVPYGLAGRSTFGPEARAEALEHAQGANLEGGPKKISRMICSQFVIAVYQAAAWGDALAKEPAKASSLAMPFAFQMQASHGSPLVLDGQLQQALARRDGGIKDLGGMVVIH